MAELQGLPPELLSMILDHLPIPSLSLLRAQSSSLKNFIDARLPSILRSIAKNAGVDFELTRKITPSLTRSGSDYILLNTGTPGLVEWCQGHIASELEFLSGLFKLGTAMHGDASHGRRIWTSVGRIHRLLRIFRESQITNTQDTFCFLCYTIRRKPEANFSKRRNASGKALLTNLEWGNRTSARFGARFTHENRW